MLRKEESFDYLINLEKKWLGSLGTKDQVDNLLDEAFLGVSSCGKFFNKDNLVENLEKGKIFPRNGIQFRINPLSKNLILLSYICMGPPTVFYENEFIFQTSIWKKASQDEWRLIYHQGTSIC